MNIIQLKLLELSTHKDIWNMSLRAIGKEIDIENAANVKYHIDQLKNKGLLKRPSNSKHLSDLRDRILKSQESLLNIPIIGSANCGVAMLVAEEMFDGYLKISPQLLPKNRGNNLFAVKAQGDSMNLATIHEERIEENDYLIVDGSRLNPKNGEYVLSVIDGCANIKKFIKDEINNRIVLLSESTKNHPPIYIHSNDSYLINGVVISVIKTPKIAN